MHNEPIPLKTRPVQDETGNIATTSQEKADLFANRLQNIHQEPEFEGFDNGWKVSVERYIQENENSFKSNPSDSTLYFQNDNSPLCEEITLEEFDYNLAKCKNRSAVGKDGISYQLLKKLPPEAKKKVCRLFSDAIQVGHFPSIWKEAIVKMIPKPNKDSKFAKNFRPISLLCCIGKILERILAKRISEHMEANNMFSSSQSGFRKHHMTTEQLLRLSEEAHLGFKKRQTTAALFLDAEAAFDKCWHNGIRYKLKKDLNLPDKIVRLLSSFLTGRTLTVIYEGCTSKKVTLNAGTPQGSPLSPLIYIIFVNDFPDDIKKWCSLSQFADDTAIWSSAYTRSYAVRKVQKSLDMLEGWCRRWRVKLNGEKSKFMFIERLKSPDGENHCLHLFNDIIRPTNQAKFLGIEIDDKLVFKKHFEAIVSKSLKHINVLRLLSRSNVKPKTLVQLYKTYIRPIIEYGSFCFLAAPKQNMSMLDKIQNQTLRICLHLPSYIRTSLLHEYASI